MEKFSLTALARQQLELAQGTSSGRSASTVYGGHEHTLRQTVIALDVERLHAARDRYRAISHRAMRFCVMICVSSNGASPTRNSYVSTPRLHRSTFSP